MILRFLNFVSDTADKLAVRFGQEPEQSEHIKKDDPHSEKLKDGKEQKKNSGGQEVKSEKSIEELIKEAQSVTYVDK